MARTREWSREEEQILRLKKSLGVSTSKIGEELGRTKGSVITRCKKLGLSVRHGPRHLKEGMKQPYLAEYTTWQYKRDHPW